METANREQSAKRLVNMACAYSGISLAELARRVGWSRQLLGSRLKAGKLSCEEWGQLGDALGADVKIVFTFPDGREID